MGKPIIEFTLSDFEEHLNKDVNQSILFSAPFGAGKTTFLNTFFENKKEDFITINLKPINYSVSENKDVFELIKFDIIFELLNKYQDQLDLNYFKPRIEEAFIPFLLTRFNKVNFLSGILQLDSEIGKPLAKLITTLYDSYKEFEKYQEDLTKDESKVLFEYLNRKASEKGSAYENDSITELIFDIICYLKETNKTCVLLIDDLDRLDPDHIFRLFNVFSVHSQSYGDENEENKFGFNKVIFVCDLNNIRKIYQHKYGSEVDFKGYINKFYSTEPFEFDIRDVIRENIEEILNHLFSNMKADYFNYFKEYDAFKLSLQTIILDLVNEHKLHFRDLLHIQPIDIKKPSVFSKSRIDNLIMYSPRRLLFRILKSFYGNWNTVEVILNFMAKNHQRNIPVGIDVREFESDRINMDIFGIANYNEIYEDANQRKNHELVFNNNPFQVVANVSPWKEIRGFGLLTVRVVKSEKSNIQTLSVYQQLYDRFLIMKRDDLL